MINCYSIRTKEFFPTWAQITLVVRLPFSPFLCFCPVPWLYRILTTYTGLSHPYKFYFYTTEVLPSGKSSSTPTHGPAANSTFPTNWTTPVFLEPLEGWTITLSPIWTQEGTGTSCSRSRSARLPKEHTLTESSLPESQRYVT